MSFSSPIYDTSYTTSTETLLIKKDHVLFLLDEKKNQALKRLVNSSDEPEIYRAQGEINILERVIKEVKAQKGMI